MMEVTTGITGILRENDDIYNKSISKGITYYFDIFSCRCTECGRANAEIRRDMQNAFYAIHKGLCLGYV